MLIHEVDFGGKPSGTITEISGNGHHGPDRIGIASVRAGKGTAMGSTAAASLTRIM